MVQGRGGVMKDSRVITKKNLKPELSFTCSMCSTEWKDNNWYAETQPNIHHMVFMPTGNEKERPTSRCPVCSIKSQRYVEIEV